ncbi:MAG: O-succinylbenzoic acid--CoA ligase [Myxococcota bacterium]|jgi:O-succinylbenzoic acid--CoA ligase
MNVTLQSYARSLGVETAQGSIGARRGVILTLADEAGFVGQGEAAPLPGFSAETLAETTAALATLLGRGGDDNAPSPQHFPASARHAVEQATLALKARRLGMSLHETLAQQVGVTAHHQVLHHRQVVTPGDAAAAIDVGFTTLKVKVGRATLSVDIARVQAIRATAGQDIALRLDANQAWDEATASAALDAFARLGVDLVEEPLRNPTPQRLAQLRATEHTRTQPIKIGADESCRSMADLQMLIEADAVDVVVLKPMLIGGLAATVKMATYAAEAGLGVVVTSTFDTTLALEAASAVAACCPPAALLVCGLDPHTASCGPPPSPGSPGQALPNPVLRAAQLRPNAMAMTDVDGGLTWAEVAAQSSVLAGWLVTQGVRPGDRVVVLTRIDRATVLMLHAVVWLGAQAIPMPSSLPVAMRHARAAKLGVSCIVDPMNGGDADPIVNPSPWPLDAVQLRVMTSGSTAEPRPIGLTTSQLAMGVFGSAMRLGQLPDDVWLVCLPLHHVGGLAILYRMAWGAAQVDLLAHFDARAVNARIDAGGVTRVSLVPEMLTRLLDDRMDRPFPQTLRTLLVGGAPTPATLAARALQCGAPLARTWGMTEAGSQLATALPGADHGSGLVPLAAVDVTIDETGRLVVRGPQTAGVIVTSDLGRLLPNGRIQVLGRADDVILSGGDNIAAPEVAAALRDIDGVADAAVVDVPSPRWGARPAALLVAIPKVQRPDVETLRSALAQRVARHAIPDEFRWVEALPRTALGKLDRPAARRLFDTPNLQGGPR